MNESILKKLEKQKKNKIVWGRKIIYQYLVLDGFFIIILEYVVIQWTILVNMDKFRMVFWAQKWTTHRQLQG